MGGTIRAETVLWNTVSLKLVSLDTLFIDTVSINIAIWYISAVIRRCLDELLRDQRRSRYWLAQESGVSEGNLRRLARQETTSIEFETLERICRALGCGTGDLLVIEDDKKVANRTIRKRTGKKPRRTKKASVGSRKSTSGLTA